MSKSAVYFLFLALLAVWVPEARSGYVHVREDFVGLVPADLFDFFANLTDEQLETLRAAAQKHAANNEAMDAEVKSRDPELAARSKTVFLAFSKKMEGLKEPTRSFISFVMQALRSAEHVRQVGTLRTIANHVVLQWNRLEAKTKDELAAAFPKIAQTLKSPAFLKFSNSSHVLAV